jgi:hypothetical protein
MAIHLNPLAQAEMELRSLFTAKGPDEICVEDIIPLLKKAVEQERLMMGEHPQCGADNKDGTAAVCMCYCHKGHYRHMWVPVIKTPALNPDGTYHLLDRCKYCPDIRLKVIKPAFVGEKHQLISLEYLIRGEQRVLSKEEWLEWRPEPKDGELIRRERL